ncbi:serine hydrolase [Candidatus Parcubacteria bacterium]|nr:serine hydrolase [Candidatus Parcubacteria bacterium]
MNKIDLPDKKTTFILAITGGVSICIILLVFLSVNVVPLLPPAPFPQDVSLDPEALTAKSAIVYDPTTGRVLFAKNADDQLPLASLTKLMAAAAVLATTDQNNVVSIKASDLRPDGDWNFQVGEKWKLSQLIRFGIVASSNDAMAAAAANAGENIITAMNRTAGSLGLTHTYFLNPTGLDLDLETSGAYGSARDVAVLAAAFLKKYPDLLEATAEPSVSISSEGHVLTATSTATPLRSIPGFIGAKTGFTDLAGGNLVAAFDLEVGHPVIVAVLGSTREGRFNDVRTIIEAARNQ